MPVISLEHRSLVRFLNRSHNLQARAIYQKLVSLGINISISGIQCIINKIRKYGTINNLPRIGRPVTACTLDIIRKTVDYIENKRGLVSHQNLARYLNISRTSARRVLKKHLHLKCFKASKVQDISANNRLKRVTYAKYLLDNYANKLEALIFTDEFTLQVGNILPNDHYRIWSTASRKKEIVLNPQLLNIGKTFPTKIMIWVGLSKIAKLKPIIFPIGTRINATSYQRLVLDKCFPEIKRIYQNQEWIFQQDNAPPHTAVIVQKYFRDNNINVMQNYPPQSPDLTICDYFLFGYLKNKIYSKPVQNTEELKQRFLEEWEKLPMKLVRKAINQWPKRLQLVIKEEGKHIEPLINILRKTKNNEFSSENLRPQNNVNTLTNIPVL